SFRDGGIMKKYAITRQPRMSRRKFLLAGAGLAAVAALPMCTGGTSDDFERRSSNGLLSTELRVRYARNRLGDWSVFARTFDGRIPGRTLRLRPGDTLQLRLFNDLPPDTEEEPMDINMPHGFKCHQPPYP